MPETYDTLTFETYYHSRIKDIVGHLLFESYDEPDSEDFFQSLENRGLYPITLDYLIRDDENGYKVKGTTYYHCSGGIMTIETRKPIDTPTTDAPRNLILIGGMNSDQIQRTRQTLVDYINDSNILES